MPPWPNHPCLDSFCEHVSISFHVVWEDSLMGREQERERESREATGELISSGNCYKVAWPFDQKPESQQQYALAFAKLTWKMIKHSFPVLGNRALRCLSSRTLPFFTPGLWANLFLSDSVEKWLGPNVLHFFHHFFPLCFTIVGRMAICPFWLKNVFRLTGD